MVVDPGPHELPMPRDFVLPDLLGDDRLLVEKPGDRFCGVCAGPCDVDTRPLKGQIAMRLRDRREGIPREDSSDPRGVALVHFVDTQREPDRQLVLLGEGRQQGMFRATRTSAFAEDSTEVRAIRCSTV